MPLFLMNATTKSIPVGFFFFFILFFLTEHAEHLVNMKRPSCFLVVFPGRGLFHSVHLFMKLCTKNTEEKDTRKKKKGTVF